MRILKVIFAGVWLLVALELGFVLGFNTQRPAVPTQAVLPEIAYPTPTATASANAEPSVPTEAVQETPVQFALVEIVQEPQRKPERQTFWRPFEEVLQAIVVPQYEQPVYVAPVTDTPVPTPVPVLATPMPIATEYVYYPGITPLATVEGQIGVVANVLPPVPTQRVSPPCDMNPIAYFRANGSDALYDLSEARDGKICAYTVVDFCPAPLMTPYADWRLALMSAADLPDEGTADDIVMYGTNVLEISAVTGASVEISPDARIFILEDEFDIFAASLVEDSCSDHEGRFILQSNGIYRLLEYLKNHIQ